jgi:putative hydrolase of the HAD superfamily
MLRLALFDLDDTLYAAGCGLWDAIGGRIERFMVERLGLAPAGVPALRRQYYQHYGTTLNGLRHEHQVDPHDYLAYVHDVPLAEFLQPSPALDQMLTRLPLRKAIFTNADAAHARRVVEHLGIARHFSAIVDIHTLEYTNKPELGAYRQALGLLGAEAGECVFVEDSPRNLLPAHSLGMLTVLVSAGPVPALPPAGVDIVIPHILALEAALAGTGRLARPTRVEAA